MKKQEQKLSEPPAQRDWFFLLNSLKALGFMILLTLLFELISFIGSFFGLLGYLFFFICMISFIGIATFTSQKNKALSNREKWILFASNGSKAFLYLVLVSVLIYIFGLWGGFMGLICLEIVLALIFFWRIRSQVMASVEQLQAALYGKPFKEFTKEEWKTGQVKMIWRKQLKAAREQKKKERVKHEKK